VQGHIDHALRLVPVLPADGCGIDLGTGGGVPGLVLAWARPGLRWVFIESQERRARWLREAARRAGVADRVEVRQARAEAEGRGGLRHEAEVVTARSFAAPGVTAECAAPFLRPGARLWVAEPPAEDPGRWPDGPLAELGLKRLPAVVAGWVGLEQVAPAPDRYPRRVGIPGKRPLF
jgi:16S rRNA (guanine527-N7)-methyltransferase